jgi:hypothetical protein
MNPSGRPIGQSDLSAGFDHALQFGGGDFGSRREHHAKHAYDEIELFVGERQRLGVSFLEVNGQFSLGSASASLGNEVARDVYATDHAATARSNDCEIPRAACHIEHARSATERLPRHEFFGDIFDRAGDLPEVAGFPCCLLFGFDGFEVWDDWGIEIGACVFVFGCLCLHNRFQFYCPEAWCTKTKSRALLHGSPLTVRFRPRATDLPDKSSAGPKPFLEHAAEMGNVLEAAFKRDLRDVQLRAAKQPRRVFETFPQQPFAG